MSAPRAKIAAAKMPRRSRSTPTGCGVRARRRRACKVWTRDAVRRNDKDARRLLALFD